MNVNYIFIGLPGAGKSAIGELVATKLGYKFVDTDFEIVKREGSEISEIFKLKGEDYFRKLETDVIETFSANSSLVISVGGGAFQKERNRQVLKRIGEVVYLKTTPEVIYSRIKDDTSRPLLQCKFPLEKIKELYEIRRANFEQADIIIDTTCLSMSDVVNELLRITNGTHTRN